MAEDLEELKQLIALQAEVSRQRLRTAAAEAFVDDYQQKLGVNQAVYAAGYGIAPNPKRTDEPTATATASVTAQQPLQQPPAAAPQPVTSSKVWPWILAAATGLGGAGAVAAWPSKTPEQTKIETPAQAVEMPRYDVEKWRRNE